MLHRAMQDVQYSTMGIDNICSGDANIDTRKAAEFDNSIDNTLSPIANQIQLLSLPTVKSILGQYKIKMKPTIMSNTRRDQIDDFVRM
jgi:hypothetical protein